MTALFWTNQGPHPHEQSPPFGHSTPFHVRTVVPPPWPLLLSIRWTHLSRFGLTGPGSPRTHSEVHRASRGFYDGSRGAPEHWWHLSLTSLRSGEKGQRLSTEGHEL